jgi:hypothetical protein
MTTILILKLEMTMFVGSISTTQLGGLTSVRSFEDEIRFHFDLLYLLTCQLK